MVQGRKDFYPQLFHEVSLDSLVTVNNFYRNINNGLGFDFLYKSTSYITAKKVRKILIHL